MLRDALRNYIPPPSETAEIWEQLDPNSPSYSVTCSGFTYEIYSPDHDEGESWGVATFALFDIVNL